MFGRWSQLRQVEAPSDRVSQYCLNRPTGGEVELNWVNDDETNEKHVNVKSSLDDVIFRYHLHLHHHPT
ncbi:hypothetical protein QVD17_40941 [Tagetes erecta]|uniref:Uncharacterized protein n=1 Tax=Tagetes erecta TaxID=13708 RepID=A0AAD8JQL9_TARER|nr:hypothetical protein QVD17_40941 [Tagetes erecta]